MEALRVYVFAPVMRVDDWYLYGLSTFVLSYLGAWLIHRYIEMPWMIKR
jgi:peptidoglycan/LPS O-acetylase OafA/YrhL